MDKIKVAMYYTMPFEYGGIEKTMYNRAKSLLKSNKYEITFIFVDSRSSYKRLYKWSELGKVINISEIRNEIFDYCLYDAVYNLKNVNARRYIQIINSNLIDSNENYEELINFDEYIAVSEESREQFKKRKQKECKIIPNILDNEEIRKLSEEKIDIEKRKYTFVTVSRVDPQKGFGRIEKILQKLKDVDYKWYIIGNNHIYNKYQRELEENWGKKYPNVVFLGGKENPYPYIKVADKLIMLSDYESQCMVMYESLILGTPVVVTDFPNAIKEIDESKGIILKKDLSNFDLDIFLNKKFEFKYNYPDYSKLWENVLVQIEKKDYKFSFLIPNYNNSEWLEKCLGSITNQTYKNYEIIFIDDMSEDDSIKKAEEILGKLSVDYKILINKTKRYNGGTRNVGIVECNSDYVISIDSDDWLVDNEVLERINNALDEEDVMFLGFRQIKDEKLYGLYIPDSKTKYDALKNDVCAIWTKVIRTNLLKNTLFVEGTLMEDKVHNFRICNKMNKWKNFREVTHYWNRGNSHSVTTDRQLKWDTSTYRFLADLIEFKEECNPDFLGYLNNLISGVNRNINNKNFRQGL